MMCVLVRRGGCLAAIVGMAVLATLFSPQAARGQSCGCAKCDFDTDGDVDQEDFGHMQRCISGAGLEVTAPECLGARFDDDVDVDTEDVLIFMACLSGAEIAYDPGSLGEATITEFMASNGDTLTDEDGDYSDWIEIHNSCFPSVNLADWYLTDDPNDLTKWRFPSVAIPRGGYLIVFASDKDRAVAGSELHTNFKLATGGDRLALVKPDGETVASEYGPQYPEQFRDVSYGLARGLDGYPLPETRRYFVSPTPGYENGTGSADLGPIIADVGHVPAQPADGEDIGVTAGVTPSVNPVVAVTLYYCVMFGSEVNITMYDDGAHGDGAAGDGVYGAVIPAAASSPGQMVRYYVTATDDQGHSSRWPLFEDPTASAQYLGTVIADPGLATQLPVLHWFVADPAAAGTDTGTYASLFYDGEFYDNVFVRRRGGAADYWPKKSFKFDFYKGGYFRWSDDAPRVEEFNLQSTYSDKSYVRQVLAWETYRDAGVPYCEAFPLRVQQNNAFHSVAVFVEQIDERFLERLGFDPEGALYKMYNHLYSTDDNPDDGLWIEEKTRLDEGYSDLQALIDAHMHTNPNRLADLFDTVNVAAVINYIAATTIMHDNDHVAKNYYLYRDTEGSGEWLVLPWDKDLTFGRNYVLGQSDAVLNDVIWADDDSEGVGAPSHPLFGAYDYRKADGGWNGLITAIHDIPQTREMYLRRLRTLMDALLQPSSTPYAERYFEQRIDELYAQMQADVALDRAKWPYNYGANQSFVQGLNTLRNSYLAARRTHLFNTHSTPGGGIIPAAQPPGVTVNIGAIEYNPATGNQDEEYIELANPNAFAVDISGWQLAGAVAHTFEPGTVIGANASMYASPDAAAFRARPVSPTGGQGHFVQGSYDGRLSARGETIELLDAALNVVDSVTYSGNPSPAQQYLRISEIMYHPADPPAGPYEDDDFEFIELANIGPGTLDLTGVHFSDGITFSFTGSGVTSLAPGEYVVVVRNLAAFESRYGTGINVAGQYDGKLENAGEHVQLDDASNEKVLAFDYDDAWYPSTDGGGHSLVIVDEYAAWDTWGEPTSWTPSAVPGGSPGGD